MREYKIGTSNIRGKLACVSRGKLVCVSKSLKSVNKEFFFNEIENSLVENKLEQYRKEANLIKNLKKGVTIGNDFFEIIN